MLTEKEKLVHWAGGGFPYDVTVVRKQGVLAKSLREGDLVWVMGRREVAVVWRFVSATEDCVVLRNYEFGEEIEARLHIRVVVRKLSRQEKEGMRDSLAGKMRVFFGEE